MFSNILSSVSQRDFVNLAWKWMQIWRELLLGVLEQKLLFYTAQGKFSLCIETIRLYYVRKAEAFSDSKLGIYIFFRRRDDRSRVCYELEHYIYWNWIEIRSITGNFLARNISSKNMKMRCIIIIICSPLNFS